MQISGSLSTAISFICDGGVGDACTTAQLNLAASDACLTALDGNDLDTICAETCLTLYTDIALSCNSSVSQTTAIESCLRYRVSTISTLYLIYFNTV